MTTPRHALVLGLGRSGRAASELLHRRGARVSVLDAKPLDAATKADFTAKGIVVGQDVDALLEESVDCCVVSPGIPSTHPWIRAAQAHGCPCISELELGWRHLDVPVVAVTGSNGKSTCVKLIAEALALDGVDAVPGGNYGAPLSELALAPPELVVAEVSTFQLEWVVDFAPDVAVLLNVYPNHLDRHASMAVYRALKFSIFDRIRSGGRRVIAHALFDEARSAVSSDEGWTRFGSEAGSAWRYADGAIQGPRELRIDLGETAFANSVLGPSAAAAAAVLDALGRAPTQVGAAARAFERLPHRMSPVGTVGGVRFVDDSKATNLAALAAALEVLDAPVRLIAGGLFKEQNAAEIKNLLATRVSAAYLLGDAMQTFAEAWGDVIPVHECGDVPSAVQAAWNDARPGEIVLLAPACASFDQFSGYEERGRVFQSCVRAIMEDEGHEK